MFVFGLKPSFANENMELKEGEFKELNVYMVDKRNDDGFVEIVYEPEISLSSVFLLNLVDLLSDEEGQIFSILMAHSMQTHQQRLDVGVVLSAWDDFIKQYLDENEVANLDKVSKELGKQYANAETSSQSDRLANIKRVLDFFNLNPSDYFLSELDKLIVDEIADLKADRERYLNHLAKVDSLDSVAKLKSLTNDLGVSSHSLLDSFMIELKNRDIPIEMILPQIPLALNDEWAREMVAGFLLTHGREIKSVIYDFIDNSREFDLVLKTIDDIVFSREDKLYKISMPLFHLEGF